MASIRQRGKSYCVIHWITLEDGTKKQKWETYHSEQEAVQRKMELENQVPFLNFDSQTHTLNDLLDQYIGLHGLSNWSFSTYTSNVGIMDNYIRPYIGDMKLYFISRKNMSQYFAKLNTLERAKNKYKPYETGAISNATKNEIKKILRAVFEQAVNWGYFESNPVKHIKLYKPAPSPKQYLSTSQVSMVINEAFRQKDLLMALVIQLAFICSMRKGEIMGLQWRAIDFDRYSICVNRELARVHRTSLKTLNHIKVYQQFPSHKPGSTTIAILKEPKTQSSIRTVFMPWSVINTLNLWMLEQKCYKKEYPEDFRNYNLVVALQNGLPLSDQYITTRFHALLKACGLPRVTFHSLRHSSTSYKLVLSGGNVKAVQGDNGHAQPNMVLSIYAQVCDNDREILCNKVEEDFCSRLMTI